jgi:hypothetical protein
MILDYLIVFMFMSMAVLPTLLFAGIIRFFIRSVL